MSTKNMATPGYLSDTEIVRRNKEMWASISISEKLLLLFCLATGIGGFAINFVYADWIAAAAIILMMLILFGLPLNGKKGGPRLNISKRIILAATLTLPSLTPFDLLLSRVNSDWKIPIGICIGVITVACMVWGFAYVHKTTPSGLFANFSFMPQSDQSHPSRGLLNYIPGNRVEYISFIKSTVIMVVPCLVFWFAPLGDNAVSRVLYDMGVLWPGVFFTYFALLLSGIPVVKVWGRSPSPLVLFSWLVLGGFFAAGIGAFTMVLSQSLTGRVTHFSKLASFIFPAGVVLMHSLVLMVWKMTVSAWQTRLETESNLVAEAQRARKLAEAQLAMMQAQIEPHFLFNTLGSVQYLIRKDSNGADFLLTQLIRYLRHAMPKMRAPMSSLGQEFQLADAFLQISRMRMGGRLTVSVELDEALHEEEFPPLVIQTLVENALKHGVEPRVGQVTISVAAHKTPDGLTVEVIDNGVGLGGAKTAGTGAGLANIRDRLQGIYGEQAQLSVVDNAGVGVTSKVTLLNAAEIKAELTAERM